ncbi:MULTISPECIES: lipoprotein [Leptotrichia]|uniref:lipoprotein n=1 Tax=Leptotrichia TaxID=32067 RepID=UPI0015B88B2E|nr:MULTISPECIES: lipoprotein [Leptotrichia]MBS6019971.1 lipoprotein [Leptotrichia wadei]NWO28238.1 lipoprotein [Leptotrichia sp. oral taxon 417]
MLNKKMNIILLFLFIFMAGCDKKGSEAKEKRDNPENIQSKTAKENIFSNNSIEKIIEIFSKKSKSNKVSIENFEKLTYENKNYYYAKIHSRGNAVYALDYSGLSATSIFLKVNNVNGANLGIIENMVVNLIQVSDENIKDSEARAIYTKILSNLGEKELSSLLTYTNGIIYGIRIDPATGELIFFARESEDEKAVTSIPKLNFIDKKKISEKALTKLGESN